MSIELTETEMMNRLVEQDARRWRAVLLMGCNPAEEAIFDEVTTGLINLNATNPTDAEFIERACSAMDLYIESRKKRGLLT